MGKVKMRKPRPSPPYYYWWDTDNCWNCPDRNGCAGCKRLKRYIAEYPAKRKRERDFRKFHELDNIREDDDSV